MTSKKKIGRSILSHGNKYERKTAKRKLYQGLKKDPRSGYSGKSR